MKKILVTGANGQLGSELKELSSHYSQFEWVFADRSVLDLSDLASISKVLDGIQPHIIINCAAYTAVDRAETETELADVLNHQAVAVLAQWAQSNGGQLVHVSTDYVFDGNSSVALTEEASTGPINVYGQTKLAGENACLRENPEVIVIRTSWVYSRFGNNFVKTMVALEQQRIAAGQSDQHMRRRLAGVRQHAELAPTVGGRVLHRLARIVRHCIGRYLQIADREGLAIAADADIDTHHVVARRTFPGTVAQPYRELVAARELEHATDVIRVLMGDEDALQVLWRDAGARKAALGLFQAKATVEHQVGRRGAGSGGDQQRIAFAAAAEACKLHALAPAVSVNAEMTMSAADNSDRVASPRRLLQLLVQQRQDTAGRVAG